LTSQASFKIQAVFDSGGKKKIETTQLVGKTRVTTDFQKGKETNIEERGSPERDPTKYHAVSSQWKSCIGKKGKKPDFPPSAKSKLFQIRGKPLKKKGGKGGWASMEL